MDRKTKILFALVGFATLFTISATFYKTIIIEDFVIIAEEEKFETSENDELED